MKNVKVLLISLCLLLTGCSKSSIVKESSIEKSSATEQGFVISDEQKEFPTENIISFYKDKLKENIKVPEYKGSKSVYFDSRISSDKKFYIYANRTTNAELSAYKNELLKAGWFVSNIADVEDVDAFLFKDSRAQVAFFNNLDFELDPYILIVFSISGITYNEIQIMKDVVIAMWGFVEDGIILEPDEQGIIRSSRDIIWDLEPFDDEEEHTEDEYLRKALRDLLRLSVNGYFPGYLFYDWYNTPTYDDFNNKAEVYLGTYNRKHILYLTSRYDGDLVRITFMAGPDTAFPHAFEEHE